MIKNNNCTSFQLIYQFVAPTYKFYNIRNHRILQRLIASILFSLLITYAGIASFAQKQVLEKKMHHLRKGLNPEWSEFPRHAEGSQLVISFNSTINSEDATIYLRQYDVNQSWQVLLNSKKVGELTIDEKDMISWFAIPPVSLSEGLNTLSIISEQKNEMSDDIRVGEIILDQRPSREVFSEARVDIEIADAKSYVLIPSRITIVNPKGVLQPINVLPADSLAVRTGVIYTGSGRASFGLQGGTYKIYASRGFEYSVDSTIVVITPGDHVKKKLAIRREVDTEGSVSCDPHIHTLTYSGHGDATIKERVITIAGEGLEVPVITEHNLGIDVQKLTDSLHMTGYFKPITGNEVTTRVGHFNIFPLSPHAPVTSHRSEDWNTLSRDIQSTTGVEAIILNHARDVHNKFRPFDPKHHISVAGMNRTGWNFPANAMEVINSGSQQTNPLQLHHDWFGMMNRGYYLTPVGSSDSHDVSRFMVGQARTYIRSRTDNPSQIDVSEVVKNFVEEKVMVSFGLLTEMVVNNRHGAGDVASVADKIRVSIKVSGPAWVQANRVTLYANGIKIREASISKVSSGGVKWKSTWVLPRPPHDVFLVAVAEGPGINAPFWPIAKPFQHTSPEWKPIVIGSSGAVWIDADKDGRRTSAFEYAKRLWDSSKGDVSTLVKLLASFDESIAVQAAAILTENGIDVTEAEISTTLQKAPLKTRKGFRRFIQDLKILRE